jgi:uncharacterized membrane protein
MKKRLYALLFAAVLAFFVDVAAAFAAPRSGGSFSGRGGFRSSGGSYSPRSYGTGRSTYGGGGSHFFFFPSFGWGWGGGYGGGFGFGSLIMLGVVAFGVFTVVRSLRRARAAGGGPATLFGGGPDYEDDVVPDRAYVYKIQLGLGRSARDIQNSLARFAAEGDTSSETGLAALLQQTSLELMRHRDSIRYAAVDASGPMSLTNGETKMNAAALAERSRFQVERVRGADGRVMKSDAAATESADALEYLVVTTVLATRQPVIQTKEVADPGQLQGLLGELGGVPARSILGLEVIWTPADPSDALSKDDLVTTYPELRSL